MVGDTDVTSGVTLPPLGLKITLLKSEVLGVVDILKYLNVLPDTSKTHKLCHQFETRLLYSELASKIFGQFSYTAQRWCYIYESSSPSFLYLYLSLLTVMYVMRYWDTYHYLLIQPSHNSHRRSDSLVSEPLMIIS